MKLGFLKNGSITSSFCTGKSLIHHETLTHTKVVKLARLWIVWASRHCRVRLIAQILLQATFFLFPKLKEYLKGNRYETDNDVQNAVRSRCRDKSVDFFADGMRQVVRRWRRYIERNGDYVEK